MGSGGPRLVYYVSGHGFGHAVRTGMVLQALAELDPGLAIEVASDRPRWLFPRDVRCHAICTDVGMIQADSLTLLPDETAEAAYEFELRRSALVDQEVDRLRAWRPDVVVGDIPPVAFDVAERLGIPGIAVGNFSWDWIYTNGGCGKHTALAWTVDAIRKSENQASLLLRLPLHGDMSAFPRIEDVPLIGRRSEANRWETRRRLGIPADRPAILLSFGGFEFERIDHDALAALRGYTFVTTSAVASSASSTRLPASFVMGPRDPEVYHDLLAACDAVVMKPGYGTVADCLVNQVPMVYATRPGFVEELVLIPAMHELGRAVEVQQGDLFAGRLGTAIESALSNRNPWQPMRTDGAQVIARRILEYAHMHA